MASSLMSIFRKGQATKPIIKAYSEKPVAELFRLIKPNTDWKEFNELSKQVKGYQLKDGDRFDVTVLHYTAKIGNYKLLEAICGLAPHLLNVRTSWGWTPLFYAVMCDDRDLGFKASQVLVKAGADLSLGTTSQSYEMPALANPFWVAAEKIGNLQLIMLLMKGKDESLPLTPVGRKNVAVTCLLKRLLSGAEDTPFVENRVPREIILSIVRIILDLQK